MDEPLHIASAMQAGRAAAGYRERSQLVKDVVVSSAFDDVMESHRQLANLLPIGSSDAEDEAEAFCRPLRQLLLKGARFCPKNNAPGRQQLHHHRHTETAAMLGQTRDQELEELEKTMHFALLVRSYALQGAQVY